MLHARHAAHVLGPYAVSYTHLDVYKRQEHQRSSENGVGTDYFTGWNEKTGFTDLLAHEYTHSWNGKYRRGKDLWVPNLNVPMQDSLLWVYEGQTQYWGCLLYTSILHHETFQNKFQTNAHLQTSS